MNQPRQLPVTVKTTTHLRVTNVQEVEIYSIPCPTCHGMGKGEELGSRKCSTCSGKARVWVEK